MKIKLLLVLLLSLLLLPAYAADKSGGREYGTVASCFDGDTLKLNDRRIVRLAGIDSPELHRKDKRAQYYSRQSRKALEDLALGQNVELSFPGVTDHDRHGRLIADMRLPDGQSVNELLVEQGAAFFYPHQDLTPEFQEKLRELQAEAIKEKRGMWEKLLSTPLAEETYIGNRATLRFFPSDCPNVGEIKPRNRVHFGGLMDAFLAGYAPARVCVFWPEE